MPDMRDLTAWIKESLFEAVPMGIAVIDQDFNLVLANPAFEAMFGPWKDRKCYSVYKGRDTECPLCKGSAAFADGKPHVNEEEGYDRHGRLTRYIKHTLPVADAGGVVRFLVEISTDITETERIKKERELLFDLVPCAIVILDRDLKIVRANKRFRETFGEMEGHYCHEAFKGEGEECPDCPARQTFADGRLHQAHSVTRDLAGNRVDLQVTTVPMSIGEGELEHVMELAVDVSETLRLEDELKIAHAIMEAMIAASIDGIIAVDEAHQVTIVNPAARDLFGIPEGHRVSRDELFKMLPPGFVERVESEPAYVFLPDTAVKSLAGESVPVRLVGMRLMMGERGMGMAFSVQDMRDMRKLEAEKLSAERLAAVGQTVAGLAHGVKNLITGLEGGMYMLKSGVKAGKVERLAQGMDMLERNIARISLFVREFLAFSKGRQIKAAPADPLGVAEEVVELYAQKALAEGIELSLVPGPAIEPANMDREGMHESLTNIVGNALDACRMSDRSGPGHVSVSVCEKDGSIVYEVTDDGVGMDMEVKKKVFTNFFTTKGTGGTGLGLLTTKKIITEHGGRIEFNSEPGQGSTFRIVLPRKRLPLADEDTQEQKA